MTLLVSGASSQIGRFLLPRLVDAEMPVLAISRQQRPLQTGVQWLRGDLHAALSQVPDRSLRAIISFSPMEAWVEWLAQQTEAPAPQIIATSSMSVITKQNSPHSDEQAIVGHLQRGEEGLALQADRLGMKWTVMRPTLIYGAGIDHGLTSIVQYARRFRLFPIPMAHGLRQPVHADDIAQAVIRILGKSEITGKIIEIGGGERLDYQQMFTRVHASLAEPIPRLYLPKVLLSFLAAIMPRTRGPVSRLEQDLVADNGPLQDLLDLKPRDFRPQADTWSPMSPEKARQRISIGH